MSWWRLATDWEAFDTTLVESAAEFFNDLNGHSLESARAVADRRFGWVPSLMTFIAEREGISAAPWPRADEDIHVAHAALSVFLAGMGNSFTLLPDGRTAGEWFSATLENLRIVTRLSAAGLKVEMTALPVLTSLPDAAAYAVAVVNLNRHRLGDRLKVCRYREREAEAAHLFLASDLRMKFCCPAHGNAQHSREFRARHKPTTTETTP